MEEKTIYIAEDDDGLRETLGEMILANFPNYSLELFPEGDSLKKGLEKLSMDEKRPDLVITDSDVPDKSLGLRIIKEYSQKTDIPMVLMSGYSLIEEAKGAGAYAFIQKPFLMQEFVGLIQRALNSRKQEQ